MSKRTPHVGDMAEHVNGRLDPREVVEVTDDGKWVKLFILTAATDWLLASNYTFRAPAK